MKKQWLNFLINPFEWIAGFQALGWGLLGMVISTVISYLSGWHYHGLLHCGPALNPARQLENRQSIQTDNSRDNHS